MLTPLLEPFYVLLMSFVGFLLRLLDGTNPPEHVINVSQ
jgi:hypothetical protein